jgi:tetratricopeptide (TPR) repeat protein
MENFIRFDAVRPGLIALLIAMVSGPPAMAAETTNAVSEPAAGIANGSNSIFELEQQQLRTYLKLQEQLHSTILAIEQARDEASQETRTNTEALTSRLALLEESLVEQRERQVETMHASNRTLLVVAGGIVGLGLLALAFTAFQHSRGMNRLADIATGLSQDRALLTAALPPAFSHGERLLLGTGGGGNANKTLLATIDRLEQRIQELEHTAQPPLTISTSGHSNGGGSVSRPLNGHSGPASGNDHISLLLGKGQVMLSLGQAESALACFEEAIAAAPEYAESHLKRGMALERLKRWDEAVASCDRAIALNGALTQAYLCKGGIFNRQERYTDALACYEQALQSESKG